MSDAPRAPLGRTGGAPGPLGLILTGGGARAAYQVGVLRAILRLLIEHDALRGNPFPIITGTSAGAINAAALACGADDVESAIEALSMIWHNIHAEQVYRADAWGVIGTGAKWISLFSLGWALARWRRARPKSLLDNAPLAELLERYVLLQRLPRLMRRGHLQALAISASSYTTGQHVTFFQAAHGLSNWTRSQRLAVRARLRREHLMASSAIPFVFPAMALPVEDRIEYFGDGSMRQAAPISPAVHLGAQRVLVVGAGRMQEPPPASGRHPEYPNLAQIAGHTLSNIFLDALAVDVERLQRINHTLRLLDPARRAETALRPIDVLVIAPSRRLDELAGEHLQALPRPVRAMLRAVGVSGEGASARGAALASYLLFEPDYTQALMQLGEQDTLAMREQVLEFMRPETTDVATR